MCYECAPICVAGIEARADNGVFFHQLVDLAVHQRRLTLLLCDGFGIRHGPLHKIRVHSDLDAVGMLSAIHFYTFAIIHTFPFDKRPGHPEGYPGRAIRNTAGDLRSVYEHSAISAWERRNWSAQSLGPTEVHYTTLSDSSWRFLRFSENSMARRSHTQDRDCPFRYRCLSTSISASFSVSLSWYFQNAHPFV